TIVPFKAGFETLGADGAVDVPTDPSGGATPTMVPFRLGAGFAPAPAVAAGDAVNMTVPLCLDTAPRGFISKPHWLHLRAESSFLVPQLGQNTMEISSRLGQGDVRLHTACAQKQAWGWWKVRTLFRILQNHARCACRGRCPF